MALDPLLLATAVDAVLRAGDIQLAAFGGSIRVDKKGTIDLVTEVDLSVERMFRAMIAERFPSHDVLAEEAGGGDDHEARYCWIFDPLDGTTNFTHGLPIFCASLGLEIDGRLEVAAVYDPCRRELFTAERGGGARLNGAPLRVSRVSTLIDALLVTGFPYDVHANPGAIVGLFEAFMRRAQAVRRLGSAALDLCYVAAGRFDGFWERGIKAWDVAAGSLLVEEAGGTLSGLDGSTFACRTGHILASNGVIHDEMLATIAAFEAGRSPNVTA